MGIMQMGFGEYERRNLRDGDSQYSTAARYTYIYACA